jgi:hypothetical protein
MTERSSRGLLSVPGLWPFLLLAVLALGVVLDGVVGADHLQVANPDGARAAEMAAALEALPEQPMVLVGMDADLGTYPEIRGTVRAVLGALLDRGARLALVSFTPEGRALATGELARLARSGVDPVQLLDLGFVAGAEAGMVLSVTDLRPAGGGTMPAAFAAAGSGIAAFDMALVVGGVDLGPRAWAEQVEPRVPELPIVAVVPTYMHPEVAPYLRTGQLAALLGTLRDDAAYLRATGAPAGLRDATASVGALPMLVGLLVAMAFIGRAVFAHPRASGHPRAHEPEEAA